MQKKWQNSQMLLQESRLGSNHEEDETALSEALAC